MDEADAGDARVLPQNTEQSEANETEHNVSVCIGLVSAAGTQNIALVESMQVASEVATAELARLMNEKTEEQNATLQRKAALLKELTDIFTKRDLTYVFKVCTETAHRIGSFSTAVPGSLEGRCIELSIVEPGTFSRGLLDEVGSLGDLVKEVRRGTRDFVVIQHNLAKMVVSVKLVSKDVFMKQFHKTKHYKTITDKSTPTEICESATKLIPANHQFDISVYPRMSCSAKHANIWKQLDLLVKGLVNVDEKPAVPLQAAPEKAPPPSAGDAGPGEPAAVEESPKKLKPRRANKAENAKTSLQAIIEMRSRQTEESRAERKRALEAAAEAPAPMSPDAVMRAVAKLGTAAAAAAPPSVVLGVQIAKKAREEKEAKKRVRDEIKKKQMESGLINPLRAKLFDKNFTLKDPILAGIEFFLNSLPNPDSKKLCKTKEKWLNQLEILKDYFTGRKSIPAKALKFLYVERLKEVTENFDAPWKDLKEQVTDFINEEMMSSNGLNPLSAFGRYLNGKNYVKLAPCYVKLARNSPVVDSIAQHFTPLFEKYPRGKPEVASGEDLVALVLRELNAAAAQVPKLLIPSNTDGNGANIKLIMDVISELLCYMRFSPSILDFLGVAALFLGLKASPISRFVNMRVFRALLAEPGTNHDALVKLADEFLKPDAVLYGDTWCPTPDLAKELKYPTSLIAPKPVENDDATEDEEPEKDVAGEEAEVEEPVKGSSSVGAAAVADDGGQASPVDASPPSARRCKGRKVAPALEAGETSSDPRRSARTRKPNLNLFGVDYAV